MTKLFSSYKLKCIQKEAATFFPDLASSFVLDAVNNTTTIYASNGLLKKDPDEVVNGPEVTYEFLNERISGVGEICAEYITDASTPSQTISNNVHNYFLEKRSNRYSYLKEKPFKDIRIDPFEMLSLNGETLDSPLLDPFKYHIKIAKELPSTDSVRVFDFPFGGISKEESIFFEVSCDGILTLLEDYEVDYIEGTLYSASGSRDPITIIGIFNIKPIKLIKKGNIKLEEKDSGFYKLINTSFKNVINLIPINPTTVILQADENIFIQSDEDNLVSVDNVELNPGVPFFLKKNSSIILRKVTEVSGKYTDFVGNISDPIQQIDSYASYLDSYAVEIFDKPSHAQVDASTTLTIYKEFRDGVYNFETPLYLNIF